MTRSNGPQTPPGAGRPQRPDPQSWAQGTPPRPSATRPAGAAYPTQQSQQPQSASAAYQQAAYGGQPGAAQADPRYAAAKAPEALRAAAPARQPSAFESLMADEDPHGHAVQQYAAQQYAARPASYPAGGQPAAPAFTPARATPAAAQADANSFGGWGQGGGNTGLDQAAFGAGAHDYGAQAGFNQGHNGFDNGHGEAFAGDNWGQDAYGQGAQQFEPAFGGQHDYQGEQGSGFDQSYADDEDYDDEPRRRSKLPLIAAAVVAALVCGGGLAYAYKALLAPVSDANMPLIKGAEGPSKFKPDDPGGRKFPYGENKIMGNPLGDGEAPTGADPAASGGSGDPNAKKVQTVEIRPDGSVVRPSEQQASPQTTASIETGPSSASTSDFPIAGQTGAAKAAAAPAGVESKPSEPQPPAAEPAAPQAALDEPPPVATPKKVTAKKVAAASAPENPLPTGPAPTGAGWVAVLASVPVSGSSQMDSLKQFADMQQKYSDVLGDKTPSVQEANLGEKGRYHRLVVGPPGSRDSANTICGGLKSQGYNGCWVTQF